MDHQETMDNSGKDLSAADTPLQIALVLVLFRVYRIPPCMLVHDHKRRIVAMQVAHTFCPHRYSSRDVYPQLTRRSYPLGRVRFKPLQVEFVKLITSLLLLQT